MKKNMLIVVVLSMIALMISGCSSAEGNQKSESMEMNVAEFEELLTQLPLAVVSTEYVVQDDTLKNLYPDMLQTEVINNTEEEIKDAVIALVAWDENHLPVKVKGNFDFTDGTYVKEVNYSEINLIGGAVFGEGFGFAVDQDSKVSNFKAIPVRFESFDGDSWENPYYDEWKTLYEGNKLEEGMLVNVRVEEALHVVSKAPNDPGDGEKVEISESELEKQLNEQELKVIDTRYTVQDEELKSLYPDLLQAILKNDTEHDIKSAVLAFVAWDENRLPIKIKGSFDFSDGSYVKLVNYNDINLVPGKTFGDDSGFEIDQNHKIEFFKAIVVSYETFEGETWENPLFKDWETLYGGKKAS